jgi:hypothetical protein
MTNAIEQSKREMYAKLELIKQMSSAYIVRNDVSGYLNVFECMLESYLELLRQDHEALHETARKRFEDIQSLEAVNADLALKLSLMTTDRDSLRNRLQAYEARESQASTSGQDSGDRASCATLDGKTAAILGALVDAQRVMTDYLVPDGIRAKDAIGKMIPILDNERLCLAMRGFESPPLGGYAAWFLNNDKCMHSFPSGEQCVFCGVGK